MINDKKLVYLAGPYFSEDPKVIKKRFSIFNKVAAHAICKEDVYVFSPISHSHPIVNTKNFDPAFWNHNYWLKFDTQFLAHCDELWVLDIDGWKESKGVNAEIEFAVMNNIPIKMVTKRGRVYKYKPMDV